LKKIGFDLDNTILKYDFAAKKFSAVNREYTSCSNLPALKAQAESLREWIDVQSWLYTHGINDAYLENTFLLTLDELRKRNFQIVVVSHKTSQPNPSKYLQRNERYDLRSIAKNRMRQLGLLDVLQEDSIFFCDSIEQKIKKIRGLGLSVFVDDLDKVLMNDSFPSTTLRILYQPNFYLESAKVNSNLVCISKIKQLLGVVLN
jgi:hypothetical protein